MKIFYVASKLSTIEEQRQDQSFFFVGKLQERRPQLRKFALDQRPDEDEFFSSETRHDTRTGPGPKLFAESSQEKKKVTTSKRFLGSSLREGGFFSSATKRDRSWETDAEHREIVNCQHSKSAETKAEIVLTVRLCDRGKVCCPVSLHW
jgi:hypothetical protein